MNEVQGDRWRYRGCSVVWEPVALERAAAAGLTVSLGQALAWGDALPEEPPGHARTVVVSGLVTTVDVLPAAEADEVLARVQRLVRKIGGVWTSTGLVFAVPEPGRFRERGVNDEVMLTVPGEEREVALGRWLWGGSAGEVRQIVGPVRDGKGQEAMKPIGYWVQRVA